MLMGINTILMGGGCVVLCCVVLWGELEGSEYVSVMNQN